MRDVSIVQYAMNGKISKHSNQGLIQKDLSQLQNLHKIPILVSLAVGHIATIQDCACLDMIGMLHISSKFLNPSSLITPLSFGEVVGGEAVCFISVYRLTIFLWCQPQLLRFNQTVESSHFRKGCLKQQQHEVKNIIRGLYGLCY